MFLETLFGKSKVIIGMAHFPPLPGQPLHNEREGVENLVEFVARDVEILARSGVDAVMFCNEGDRPYRTHVGPEVPAVMAAAICEIKRDLDLPFGVDVLWDPIATLALGRAVGAAFVREVFSGAYAGDFGIWNTDPAQALEYRRRIGADDVKLFFNVTAEFAAPLAPRDIGLASRSAVFSSLADAICVSGAVTGTGVDVADLAAAKEAVGDAAPVFANTGVRPETVGEILSVADGCFVGTAFKRDGSTWNEIDPDRVAQLVAAAASSGAWEPRERPVSASDPHRESFLGRTSPT